MSSNDDSGKLATTPTEVARLFGELVSAGDLEGALALYDDDASVAADPSRAVSGRAAVRDAVARLIALQPALEGTVVWVQQVSDVALVLNDWTLDGRDPAGEPVHMTGRGADVLRRGDDGGWRFLIDCPWARDVALRPAA